MERCTLYMGSEVEGPPVSTLESKFMSQNSPVLVLRLFAPAFLLAAGARVLCRATVLLLCMLRQCMLASFVTVVNQVVVVSCVACKHCRGGPVGTPQ